MTLPSLHAEILCEGSDDIAAGGPTLYGLNEGDFVKRMLCKFYLRKSLIKYLELLEIKRC